MNAPLETLRFGSGKAVRRVEDPALVQGQGRFTDDRVLPGQTWLAFVRSDRAHARIVSIDTDAARALPGVVAIYTGADLVAAGVQPMAVAIPFKQPGGGAFAAPPKRALAHEVVRYVGEPVVAVVAESRDAAKAAAQAVWVTYDDLPAVADIHAAIAPGAPTVWPEVKDNRCAEAQHGDAAATEAAFARAAHRVSLAIDNQRLAPVTLEPRAVLAWVEDGRLTLYLSSQMPTAVRGGLAAAIPGLDAERVRVTVGDVGGGFGMKTGVNPEDIVLGYAAWTLKRPVKWQAERVEDFLSAVHGRGQVSRAELALDAQGRVLALRVRTYAGVGAYPSATGIVIPLLIGPWVSTSIYDIPLLHLKLTAVLTLF